MIIFYLLIQCYSIFGNSLQRRVNDSNAFNFLELRSGIDYIPVVYIAFGAIPLYLKVI